MTQVHPLGISEPDGARASPPGALPSSHSAPSHSTVAAALWPFPAHRSHPAAPWEVDKPHLESVKVQSDTSAREWIGKHSSLKENPNSGAGVQCELSVHSSHGRIKHATKASSCSAAALLHRRGLSRCVLAPQGEALAGTWAVRSASVQRCWPLAGVSCLLSPWQQQPLWISSIFATQAG